MSWKLQGSSSKVESLTFSCMGRREGWEYGTVAQNSSLKKKTREYSFWGVEKTGCCVSPYFKVTGPKGGSTAVIGAEMFLG